jgi:hypothetical protein
MNASRRETERGRMELLVFSILVTIDGEGGEIGPYSLRPQDDDGNEGGDLASDGDMHHRWANRYCLADGR